MISGCFAPVWGMHLACSGTTMKFITLMHGDEDNQLRDTDINH
jgi:hypothetical protein